MPPNKLPAAKHRLELEIEDFGPIVKARLDLRPLTVLVGPSNTGKSYLAILIYALHQIWSTQTSGPIFPGRRFRPLLSENFEDVSEQVIDAAVEFAEQLTGHDGKPSVAEELILPASITKVISKSYNELGGYLDDEIRRCFGVEKSAALIRRGVRGEAGVAVRLHHDSGSTMVEQHLRIKAQGAMFRIRIPENVILPADKTWNDRSKLLFEVLWGIPGYRRNGGKRKSRSLYRFELLETLAGIILPLAVGPLARRAFYLPADRTGVMHAHSVVVSALIGSAAMAGVRPATRTPMLTGVLADFMEELIALGQQPSSRSNSSHSLGSGIETAILKGSIRVEKSKAVGYPHFTYSPEGWNGSLSLANASSMVSELAPLVLYLRHRVGSGNVLIIEEPESHLHPAMQVQLMQEIAKLVQAGVRVVVTTHSEWILEELGNIVGRSGLPDANGEVPHGGWAALSASDVGVWLFEPKERPKGSVVREAPLDDSGLYPTGFDEVAAALHNNWADISSRSRETG